MDNNNKYNANGRDYEIDRVKETITFSDGEERPLTAEEIAELEEGKNDEPKHDA